MSVETAVMTLQTVSLVAVSILLAYPVARYSTNVAYTRGMVTLSAAFFALSIGYAIGTVTSNLVAERLVILLAAVLALVGVTYFARPFIEFDETEPFADADAGEEDGDAEGGFGDAVRE